MPKSLGKRRLLIIVFIVELIPVAFAGLKIMENCIGPWMHKELTGRPINWWMRRWEWNCSEFPYNSTLAVRGIISEILTNYVTHGLGIHYYILPAVFTLNVTETIWISDKYVTSWKHPTQVLIAYDYKDVSQFSVGQHVETHGWWECTYDTTFSMMLVVGPCVNGSYVKAI